MSGMSFCNKCGQNHTLEYSCEWVISAIHKVHVEKQKAKYTELAKQFEVSGNIDKALKLTLLLLQWEQAICRERYYKATIKYASARR